MTTAAIRARRFVPAWWMVAAALVALAVGAAVAADAGIALALTALILAPVLIWADPRISIGLFALALGCNIDVVRAPVHVSLPQLLALASVAGLAVRKEVDAPRTGVWAAAGGLFALSALPSLARAASLTGAVQGMIELAVLALVLGACVHWLVRRPDAAAVALDLLVIGAALSVGPAVIQVAFDIGPAAFRSNGWMRGYSTYTQPNTWGLYLAGVFPVAVSLAAARRSLRWSGAASVIALGLVLCASRGAWLGAVFGLAALAVTAFRLRARTLLVLASGAIAFGVMVSFAPADLIAGRLDFNDWSTQQRLLVLLTTWDGILRSPITGWGPGSFEHMLPAIARQGLVDDVVMPHNLLLEIWFQLGLLALLCFVGLVAALVITTFRAARRTGDVQLAGLLGGTVGTLGAALFGTLFIRGVQESFVLLIALTAVHLCHGREQPANRDADPVPV